MGLRAQSLSSGNGQLGGPLTGTTTEGRRLFDAGRVDFLENETVEEGLGPAFNGISCAGCHSVPVTGGVGNVSLLRAGRVQNGRFVEPAGGSLVHLFATEPRCQPQVPRDATIVSRRIPTPLFGAGLVEAIPDETLIALQDRPTDGVRGRAARVRDLETGTQRVGRFGWKSQHATLLAFSADAYLNEMGITNDLMPTEAGTGLTAGQLAACDPVPGIEDERDPITGRRSIDNFTNFMRFLAPIPSGPADSSTRRGEDLFASTGCAACHVPLLHTGPNTNAALDRKAVPAYSDFLLHDVGTGDGIEQGAASGDEFRTTPLWGLRFRKRLLHDGRALTPQQAIEAHGNSGDRARDRYRQLSPQELQALNAFLNSL